MQQSSPLEQTSTIRAWVQRNAFAHSGIGVRTGVGSHEQRELMQRLSRLDDWAELLNPNLLFGTAWFWTLPEVHEAQKEIDARNAELRRLINQTL